MSRRNVILSLIVVLVGTALAITLGKRSFVHKQLEVGSSESHISTSAPVAVPQRSWPTPFSVKLRELPIKEDLPLGTLRILVLGDSVAKFLGLAMRYRQDEKKTFVAERGVGDCSIFEPEPYIENGKKLMSTSCSTDWAKDVAELRPDVTLIMMGGGYFSKNACEKQFAVDYDKRIFDLTRAMGKDAGQIVITRVPYPVKSWRHSNVMERVDCFNEVLSSIAKKGQWELLDLMSHVCPTRECNMESEGKPIRPDGLHFDGGGTEETARWTLDELRRLHGLPRAE